MNFQHQQRPLSHQQCCVLPCNTCIADLCVQSLDMNTQFAAATAHVLCLVLASLTDLWIAHAVAQTWHLSMGFFRWDDRDDAVPDHIQLVQTKLQMRAKSCNAMS